MTLDLLPFFQAQLADWPLARANYDNLKQALFKDVYPSPYERIRLVCLPARIASSSAKITAKGQVDRPCFLCSHRLPAEQRAYDYGSCNILVNPFPVFSEHYTVPAKQHQDQSLMNEWPVFYRLLCQLDEKYLVFYNGGRCGASAPDHLHFQLGLKNVMPLQADGMDSAHLQALLREGQVRLYRLEGYTRKAWVLEGPADASQEAGQEMRTIMQGLLSAFGRQLQEPQAAEQLVNVVGWREAGQLRIVVFPRAAHRPHHFYSQDEAERLVTSPASVEMMGYYIFPRQEDFHKVTAETLRQIYQEVSLSTEAMDRIQL